MEKAVSLDPDFAAALGYLGVTYGYLGDTDARKRFLNRANLLAGKVSEKERVVIQATKAFFVDRDQARDYFNKYAALNPKDANPIDSLAELDYQAGSMEKAAAGYSQVTEIDPAFGGDIRLAIVQALQENYAAALESADAWVRRAPSAAGKADGRVFQSVSSRSCSNSFAGRESCLWVAARSVLRVVPKGTERRKTRSILRTLCL